MENEALAASENTENPELENIQRKMHFTGTVMKTTIAGAVVDIGIGTPGVVHISQLSTEPVNRVEDVVTPGQQVDVWVKRVFPKKNRVELTMIKPLELEWREITKGMVVHGKVTRLEKFGIFVDIGAERPGLVHISEMTHGYIKNPGEIAKEGDELDVQVLNVNRQKKQIKLSMKALEEKPEKIVKEPLPQAPRASSNAEELPKDEPIPTAMEMALREAMERSKGREVEAQINRTKRKSAATNNEIEQILARTLKNKAKTK